VHDSGNRASRPGEVGAAGRSRSADRNYDQPGGAAAWRWFTPNVDNPIANASASAGCNWQADPQWAIIPRQ
jgi:hypothetical protein